MKKTNFGLIIILFCLSLVIISFSFWYFQPSQKLNIFILDKTVTDFSYREHASLTWVLKNRHVINSKDKLYSLQDDYYGFIPLKSWEREKEKYRIRSIRLFEVLTMSDQLDMLYYADSYGVFNNDLNDSSVNMRPYLIYGGLNQNDYLLMREMKRKNKLVIAEFNLLGSPTSELIREKTEELFDFKWTGWSGRYFKSLKNIVKNQIPAWIITAYQKNYKKIWDFSNPGVVLVNEDGRIMVLEENLEMVSGMPTIYPSEEARIDYHLSSYQKYGFWFDIVQTSRKNKIQAYFKLDVTKTGEELLKKNGVPNAFPAILEHTGDYKFYYFSGDFSDNEPPQWLSYFKGLPSVMDKIHTGSNGTDHEFFWNFYVPLINGILDKNFD